MLRGIYAVAVLVCSALAGFFYYAHTREIPVVVATRDLAVGTQLQAGDLDIRAVAPAAVPSDALSQPDEVIGQFVIWPALRGSLLDRRQVSTTRTSSAVPAGITLAPGSVIISVPISPAAAVGAALTPGELVDVVAIPNAARAATGTTDFGSEPTVIGTRVPVIGLRSEAGTPMEVEGPQGARPGSVLLAIRASDEERYAAASASSTFFLALATD